MKLRNVPLFQKTIAPLDIGLQAGGEKFLVKALIFKILKYRFME